MLVHTGATTRAVTNDHLLLAINTDTSANYSYTTLFGDGNSMQSTSSTGQGFAVVFGTFSGTLAAAPHSFGMGITHILNYTNTSFYKTMVSRTGTDTNGAGIAMNVSNFYKGTTNAVSNLYCVTYTNFVAGSTLSLYGVRSVGQ
jgi:hypothetical protein